MYLMMTRTFSFSAPLNLRGAAALVGAEEVAHVVDREVEPELVVGEEEVEVMVLMVIMVMMVMVETPIIGVIEDHVDQDVVEDAPDAVVVEVVVEVVVMVMVVMVMVMMVMVIIIGLL